MTHNVYEMVSYVTHILRLQPGDIVSTGSPAGVGTARETPLHEERRYVVVHDWQHRHAAQPSGGAVNLAGSQLSAISSRLHSYQLSARSW
jgi:2-keto-4-pentenoate hydratase/2-oxohepta-3-ene-1,7-dioic acid hydratase in catechol pathway